MEVFSALLALCVGNSPVTGEFPSQRPVMRSFDILFDLRYDVIVMTARQCIQMNLLPVITYHFKSYMWIFIYIVYILCSFILILVMAKDEPPKTGSLDQVSI